MKKLLFYILAAVLITAIAYMAVVFYRSNSEIVVQSPPPAQTLPASSDSPSPSPTPPYIVSAKEISRGNADKKQIIFTFDSGAGAQSAQKILEITKKHGLKTTFFITGKFAQQNPELIKQIAQEGHEIFNHTYSHPHLPRLTDEQIKEEFQKTDEIISGLTGISTKPFFRPPFGERNPHVLEVAAAEGYQSVFWTLDALDWMPDKTAEQVKQRIYANLQNGAIILMHVGDDITGNVLDEVFTYVENQGYKIMSLTEGIK